MMPMLPPPASPSPLAGEGRAPASPSPLAGEGRGGGSAVRIVKKLRVRNPHHLTAAGSVAGQRIVQPPTIEHPLEVRQPLGIGDVRHRQQPLELISRDPKAAIDRLDG